MIGGLVDTGHDVPKMLQEYSWDQIECLYRCLVEYQSFRWRTVINTAGAALGFEVKSDDSSPSKRPRRKNEFRSEDKYETVEDALAAEERAMAALLSIGSPRR